jgi:hypothetical protein
MGETQPSDTTPQQGGSEEKKDAFLNPYKGQYGRFNHWVGDGIAVLPQKDRDADPAKS